MSNKWDVTGKRCSESGFCTKYNSVSRWHYLVGFSPKERRMRKCWSVCCYNFRQKMLAKITATINHSSWTRIDPPSPTKKPSHCTCFTSQPPGFSNRGSSREQLRTGFWFLPLDVTTGGILRLTSLNRSPFLPTRCHCQGVFKWKSLNRSKVSWVMVTWGPPLLKDRQTDRHAWLKTLPCRNFVGRWY